MTFPRKTKPTLHLYEGATYVKAEHTDIRKTFEKYKQAQKPVNVTPIKKVKP